MEKKTGTSALDKEIVDDTEAFKKEANIGI